jgi:hypothetical protein
MDTVCIVDIVFYTRINYCGSNITSWPRQNGIPQTITVCWV